MRFGRIASISMEEPAILFALLSIWIYVIIVSVPEGKTAAEAISTAEPLLIIDAGHGGLDGGAVSVTGRHESEINLEIALRLRDLTSFLGIRSFMTRETESIEYPGELSTIAARKKWDTRRRVEQINAADNCILISIHQNTFPSGQPRGPQVLFADTSGSRLWGEAVQERLTENLYPESRRTAVQADRSIYLMSHIRCPAILVECGFVSNRQEAVLLESGPYQLRIAAILAAGITQYTGDMMT